MTSTALGGGGGGREEEELGIACGGPHGPLYFGPWSCHGPVQLHPESGRGSEQKKCSFVRFYLIFF